MTDKASSQFSTPILYGIGLVALATIMLAGLRMVGAEESAQVDQTTKTVEAASAPIAPRFDPAAVAEARAAVLAEAKVVDLVYDESLEVEWNVAVENDGTRRHGYASYLCLVLDDFGVVDGKTKVRIVDAARAAAMRDAYGSYQLGTVHCQTGQSFE